MPLYDIVSMLYRNSEDRDKFQRLRKTPEEQAAWNQFLKDKPKHFTSRVDAILYHESLPEVLKPITFVTEIMYM